MYLRSVLTAAAALAALGMAAAAADARSLKWARTADALTLDPHAQNEGPTHNLMHQIYEPLLIRDAAGKVLPTLALSWKVTSDTTVWEFKLRQGVRFHNGNPFNADDVVFSLERARQPTSDMKGLLSSIETVSKVDDHTVHIKTKGPNPLLPNYLTNLFMMDKEWSEANNTITVQDYKGKKDNFAVRNANGTGPYALVSREQDVKMLAKIGIKVNLVAQPRGPHFTLIQKNPPETEFYMVGWGVPTYDSQYIFSFLYHSRSGSDGSWNATRYSNADTDAAIQSLNREIDTGKRNATIASIWKAVSDETNYIALHHQMLAYAMKSDLDMPVSPENTVFIKFVAAK